MTLPTGAISFSDINQELGLSSTATISLNDALVRLVASVGNTGVQTTNNTTIQMASLQGHAYGVYQIGSTSTDVNVTSYLTSTGHYAAGKTYGVVTINGGVVIGASSVGQYAFNVQGSDGDLFAIQNSGYIVGKGGDGGQGGGSSSGTPSAGQSGGSGVYIKGQTQSIAQFQNGGIVGGGGGGGGGGDWKQDAQNQNRVPMPGGGGGGGAGYQVGAGAASGQGGFSGNSGQAGQAPAGTSGGAGGSGLSTSGYGSGTGGQGGGLGQAGQTGFQQFTNGASSASGGAAGNAVVGTNYVQGGSVGGTVYGGQVNS